MEHSSKKASANSPKEAQRPTVVAPEINKIKARCLSLSPQKLVEIERISPAAYKLVTRDIVSLIGAIESVAALAENKPFILDEIMEIIEDKLT